MDIIVDRISSCSTTIRGGVKKEEEEEEIVVKKKEEEKEEEEAEVENEEDHVKKNCSKDSRPNCSKIINGNNNQHLLDYNDDYADWTKGNWCWLLPTANNGITTTHHSAAAAVKSEESSSSDNTTTIPPVIGKRAPKRRRESHGKQQQRDTSVVPAKELLSENDDDEELPKKKKNKLKSCRLQQQYNSSTIYPKNSSSSSNDAIQDNETKVDDNKNEKGKVDRTIIKREEGINIKEEEDSDSVTSAAAVNNNNNNDNDNDNIVHENDFGYESWTEGNWCLLLPSTTTTTTTTTDTTSAADVDKNNVNEPPSEEVSVIENNTTQRRLCSSSRRRSDISSSVSLGVGGDDTDENEYDDEDYVDNNDDIIDKKTKTTEKRAVKHKNNAYSKIWQGMFQRLGAYKKQHGSTNVPRSCKEHPKLAIWVNYQRTKYNKKDMSIDRISRLVSIGFVWKMLERLPWDEMFQKLVAYKKQHKSTNVPERYAEDPKLGNWVHHQRVIYSNKELSIKRINHLESIGFVWNALDAQWMEMYNRLVTYNKKYNSTIVPGMYKTHQKLATWVSNQRHTYNKGSLLEKRWELLNSINFVWSAKKASS
jgi:hypothetical protein